MVPEMYSETYSEVPQKGLLDFKLFTLETLMIQVFILVVIIWVLQKWIFKPYLAYLDTEGEKRKKLEDEYKNITLLKENAEKEKEAILEEARKDAEATRNAATSRAKKEAQSITDQAQWEAEALKLSAQNQIEKEREKMMTQVREKSIDLVLKFNAKLFDSEKVNADFVQKQIHSFK